MRTVEEIRTWIAEQIKVIDRQMVGASHDEGLCGERICLLKCLAYIDNRVAALLSPGDAPAVDAYAVVKSWQGPLWDAVNAYMLACGGHGSKGGEPRIKAVSALNRTLEGLVAQVVASRWPAEGDPGHNEATARGGLLEPKATGYDRVPAPIDMPDLGSPPAPAGTADCPRHGEFMAEDGCAECIQGTLREAVEGSGSPKGSPGGGQDSQVVMLHETEGQVGAEERISRDGAGPGRPVPGAGTPLAEPGEGDKCLVDGCGGTYEFKPDERCFCHLSPPCHYCVPMPLVCSRCGDAPPLGPAPKAESSTPAERSEAAPSPTYSSADMIMEVGGGECKIRLAPQASTGPAQPAPGAPVDEVERAPDHILQGRVLYVKAAIVQAKVDEHVAARLAHLQAGASTGRECWALFRPDGGISGFSPKPPVERPLPEGYEWRRMVEAAAPTPAGCSICGCGCKAPKDGPSPSARDASRREYALSGPVKFAVTPDGMEINLEEYAGIIVKMSRAEVEGLRRFIPQTWPVEPQTAQPSLSEAKGPSPSSSPSLPAMDLEDWRSVVLCASNRMVEAAQRLEMDRDPERAPSTAKVYGVLALRLRESGKALLNMLAAPGAPPLPRPMEGGFA